MFHYNLIHSLRGMIAVLLAMAIFASCNWKQEPAVSEENVSTLTPPTIPMDQAYFNEKIPSIQGVNPYGDSFNMRQIKAKYILLEFWASWCPPCRKANPGLVEVYKKYKSQGLEIVSISLDTDAEKWKKAIEADQLTWPYHLCDFKDWDSKWAIEYKIEEIPNNVLYSSDGKVIAQSLEPQALDKALKELLSK